MLILNGMADYILKTRVHSPLSPGPGEIWLSVSYFVKGLDFAIEICEISFGDQYLNDLCSRME